MQALLIGRQAISPLPPKVGLIFKHSHSGTKAHRAR
jgi:hypothetical protein